MTLLLTGPRGCGKTTIVLILATLIAGAAGFYTGEIRERGARAGFRLVDIATGEESVFHMLISKGPAGLVNTTWILKGSNCSSMGLIITLRWCLLTR